MTISKRSKSAAHTVLILSLALLMNIKGGAQLKTEVSMKHKTDNKMQEQKGMENDEMTPVGYIAPDSPEKISPLLSGESIPAAVLPDASGKDLDLNKAIAARPTVLVFYRGGWCPFCSRQLAGLQQIYSDLKAMGFQLIAIGTDDPAHLDKTARKENLDYTLLSDADLSLAKKVGLAYKAPAAYDKVLPEASGGKNTENLLPVPSVFILNRKGEIQFEYINPDFRQRLNPDLLKAAAKVLYSTL